MPKDKKVEVEVVDESLNDFLEDDNDNPSSNRVSFQLDTDGTPIGEIEDVEVELEENEEDKYVEKEEDSEVDEPQDSGEDEDTESVDSEEERKKAEEAEKAEKKRKSRAKERIKQQNAKIKELENFIATQNAEMEAIKAEYDETTSTYAKVELERLTADVARLEAALKAAAEDGDGEKIASITKQLIESQSHIRHLQNVADTPEKQKPQPQKTQSSSNQGLSEAAEEWTEGKEFLINNDEYASLDIEQRKKLSPVRQEMANIARQLLAEGFSNADPVFYEEMDIRLSGKFDFYEALASDGLDALNYTHSESENSDNDASGETEKPRTTNKSKNVPAKGPSRSSSPNSNSQNKGSNKVVIDKEMYRYWKNHLEPHGITLQDYALEIKKDNQRQKF
jgi:hypothetical protein